MASEQGVLPTSSKNFQFVFYHCWKFSLLQWKTNCNFHDEVGSTLDRPYKELNKPILSTWHIRYKFKDGVL